MSDKFSIEEVTKIAKLSNLILTDEEKSTFAHQFSTIMEYFDVLETMELEGDEAGRNESKMVIARPDVAKVSGINPADFSPYIENKCFKVPKVIDAG